jgi:hypothetical protein
MENNENAKIVAKDASAAPLFCDGALGFAHVMAHRLLDAGQPEGGRRILGRWLEGREGAGSDCAHVQWHMAVFEIATGRRASASERFSRHIEPAVRAGAAYTDGPSLLWRLSLASASMVALPWEAVRDAAVDGLQRPNDSYVELHHLLALAGAGDVDTMRRWLGRRAADAASRSDQVLTRMAQGLFAFAARDYSRAAVTLAATAPKISRLGGSRAQNELFELISREARWRAEGTSVFAGQRAA